MAEKRKTKIRDQILVAVGITLLASGTAPWWWDKLFPKTDLIPPGKQNGATGNQQEDIPVQPTSDFPSGTKRVYSADFSKWPTSNSEYGTVTLDFGNSYLMQPSGNTWIGPGRSIEITTLEGDFIFDVRFRIEERNPNASLSFDITGSGTDAESIDVYFSVWDKDNVTYTLTKSRVRSGGGLAISHVVTEEMIAEREQIPFALKDHDWSKGSKLTLKRESGRMQFFVNDRFVKEFSVSLFPVTNTSVKAAFKSKFVVTSIEARVKGYN